MVKVTPTFIGFCGKNRRWIGFGKLKPRKQDSTFEKTLGMIFSETGSCRALYEEDTYIFEG